MKRQKERQRAEKRTIKEEKKARRKAERVERAPGEEDPDIAGIVPGPQAPLE
jgi:hypothetical protein